MKAMVLERFGRGEPLRWQEWPDPQAGEGEVLVEIHAAGVNPIDFKLRDGKVRLLLPYRAPLVLGSEFAGTVAEVGPGVTRFKRGDKVFGRPDKSRSGTFAPFLAVREEELAHKPRRITMEEAAGLPLAGLTAWQALHDVLRLQAGQRLLIHAGAGGVGTLAVQLAKGLGAYVAATAQEPNHELVYSLGADVVVDYHKFRFETIFQDYDAVLDTIGGETLLRSFQTLKPRGKVVSVAGLPDRDYARREQQSWLRAALYGLISRRIARAAAERKADYHFLLMRPSGEQLARLAELVDSGALKPVVDRIYPIQEAEEALAYVETGHARGKVILRIKDLI